MQFYAKKLWGEILKKGYRNKRNYEILKSSKRVIGKKVKAYKKINLKQIIQVFPLFGYGS